MIVTIALIGRSNVGKSTFFNSLTNSRNSLVLNVPGVTRDRNYGCLSEKKSVSIIDTSGFFYSKKKEKLAKKIDKSTFFAIQESDILVFLVNAYDGLLPDDFLLAKMLRCQKKPILLVINKLDKIKEELEINEFYELGFKNVFKLSSLNKKQVKNFVNNGLLSIVQKVKRNKFQSENIRNNVSLVAVNSFKTKNSTLLESTIPIKVSIVGRPNVGKSTLLNSIVGFNRVITSNLSGTTRDSIEVLSSFNGLKYSFIDTAGIKKKLVL